MNDPRLPPTMASTTVLSLAVVAGPHQGEAMPLEAPSLVIGRAPGVGWQLIDDHRLSRQHFALEQRPGLEPQFLLRDLSSSNGTFVNGQRITEHVLADGDVITAGNSQLRVVLTPQAQLATLDAPAGLNVPTMSNCLPSAPRGQPPVPHIPGCRVIRLLGEGGMGAVYLATNDQGERIAVKVIIPESSANEHAAARFLREAKVLSELQHPLIVRFLDAGTSQGQLYILMEYVETIDLATVWSAMDFAGRCRTACGLVCDALEALDHAHTRGFVHRDIKPSNLLVERQDGRLRARVADFGLAKNFETAGLSGLTHEGQVVGTLGFMPPEQVRESRMVKPAGDLYSVGATLYYLIAGRLPHSFDGHGNPLEAIAILAPVPLEQVCPAVSPELARLIHQALAKDPANRPASARAMREALLPHAEPQVRS